MTPVWPITEWIWTNILIMSLQLHKCHFIKSPQQTLRPWRRCPCIHLWRRICFHSHHTPRKETVHSLLSGRQSTRRGWVPCMFLQPLEGRNRSLFPCVFQVGVNDKSFSVDIRNCLTISLVLSKTIPILIILQITDNFHKFHIRSFSQIRDDIFLDVVPKA